MIIGNVSKYIRYDQVDNIIFSEKKNSITLYIYFSYFVSSTSIELYPIFFSWKMDRFILFSLVIFALTFASFVRADFSAEDPLIRQVVSGDGGDDDPLLNADHHFSLFKSRYGKSYATQEEHDYRFSVFKKNLRRAKRHQLLDPSAVHGVTKFSDLTPKEFRRTFHGVHKSRAKKLKLKLPADANKAPILPTDNLPTDFDWRDHGAVTGVKNQVFFNFQL